MSRVRAVVEDLTTLAVIAGFIALVLIIGPALLGGAS